MAASAWAFYEMFREYMADGTIDLDTNSFDLHLYTSASNAATLTVSTATQLTNELASGNGYSQSGKALTSVTWATGASGGARRFDCADVIFTATGGNLTNIRYAVIVAQTGTSGKDGANKLVCESALSTGQFTINDASTLTVQMNASGVFELT